MAYEGVFAAVAAPGAPLAEPPPDHPHRCPWGRPERRARYPSDIERARR